jgi:hypothetical protein
LREEDFWSLTPLQFAMLSERYDIDRKNKDLGPGIVASTVANCHRGKTQRPFKAEDFMPKYGMEIEQTQTPEQMHQYWQTFVMPAFSKEVMDGNRN